MKKRLLIVDDDPVIQNAVRAFFEAHGFETIGAGDVAGAQIAFRSRRPDAAIIDFILPDGDALELLERFKSVDPNCPTVVLTGHGSIGLAVQAIQHGASQFLTKPVDLPALKTVIDRCLATETLRRKDAALHARSGAGTGFSPFAGISLSIAELEAQVRRIVRADSPVLITGETGTGKGILAHWIHENGPRAAAPFVDLNCAGLAREFLDTELFGHEKGAFTGAVASKAGLFEIAHGGTMFLDEIGDVDLHLQPKLLKVVEEKHFRRLGEVTDRTVDVRLIGATHRDLAASAMAGQFRTDLFFRISTIPLHIPPLRERPEDIDVLAATIVDALCRTTGRREASLAPRALEALRAYRWPGNVRELRNVLERALLLTDGDVIDPTDLNLGASAGSPPGAARDADLELTLEDVERRHIDRILRDENGHVDRAAARLGISRSSLYTKIRVYGLAPSRV
jgi:DNA-binding NtrC family response regulator